jgi:hypothetical protein
MAGIESRRVIADTVLETLNPPQTVVPVTDTKP